MTCRGCNKQVCACPDAVYSGLAEPLFVTKVMPVSGLGRFDHLHAGSETSLVTAPGILSRPLRRGEISQPPESATPPCGALPITGETSPRLAGDLFDQSARDRDAHGARGEVKGAAVHAPAYRLSEVATS